ncbi:hypothetical protein MIR68_009000 [Amoeboaphelidium protococcarum]|nr:hypothetical protein MIR68_009000 [Amoeboaphelidium protococcarum]
MQYLVWKLCSLLATVVIFTRSIPSEDLPIKCRLRDNAPAGEGPDSCASCTRQAVVSELPSIPCSSNAITRASSSTASSTVQVISSTPSTITWAVVKSTTCTSSQLINTFSQDKTSAIPTTQPKFTQYTSSQITSSQSKAVKTEYGSTSTLSTNYTSTADQIPSLTKTSSCLLRTSAQESIFASTSTTIAVSTTTVISTPSTKTRRKIRTQRVNSSYYSSAASSSALSETKTRPTASTTVRTTTHQSIPTSKPLRSSAKVSKTKTRPTTSKKMSTTTVHPPKTTTRQPVITPTPERPQNPVTVPEPPPPAKLPMPLSQKPLVPASPPPPAPPVDDVPVDNGSSCCASPLVFDVNYDWRVQVKFGTGIWLDPSNVTELHAGADGGDVMLAMPDMNGNGQIDIEEVFGNRTLSPFTNVSYKAANGFEALHQLAIEADAQPLCTEKSANPKDKSVLVSLPKLKACLQKYGHDLGFISGDNVKVLQPLNQVDTVDVVDYVETPDDCKGGMKHAQKGHYYDKAGHEWRVDDVWFMTGTPYSKGLI